jgi:hypothetical protein
MLYFRFILSAIFVVAITGCEGVSLRSPFKKPLSIQISATNHPLNFTRVDQTPPSPLILSASLVVVTSTPTNSPPVATAAPSVVDATQVPSAASTPAPALLPASPAPTLYNTTAAFNLRVNVQSAFPASVPKDQQSCSMMDGFLNGPTQCSLDGFDISSSDITSGQIRIQAKSLNGKATDVLTSNTLPIELHRLKQLSPTLGFINGVMLPLQNRLWFVCADPVSYFTKLCSTDGTDFVIPFELNPGGNDAVSEIVVNNGRLYFTAFPNGNAKLYSTNGFDLKQHIDIHAGGNDNVNYLTVVNGRVFFQAYDSGNHYRVFSTNGTDLIQHTNNSPIGDSPYSFLYFNGRTYFGSNDASSHNKLFSTNGSDLKQVSDTNPGNDDQIADLTEFNGRLYFFASEPSGENHLYSTDGTDLKQVTDTNPAGGDFPSGLTVMNGRLYFVAFVALNQYKLFSTNGSDFKQHTDFVAGGNDAPSNLTVFQNRLYFSAYSTATDRAIFSTDGTDLKQHTLAIAQTPSLIKVVNGRLFFMDFLSGIPRLFSTDGTHIRQHSDLNPAGDGVTNLFSYQGRTYFNNFDANGHFKLFSTDGLDLQQHTDLNSGDDDFDVFGNCIGDYFQVINDQLFLSLYPHYNSGATCEMQLYSLKPIQ